MEVMHERNAHNFPLDLASDEVLPVALTTLKHKFLLYLGYLLCC